MYAVLMNEAIFMILLEIKDKRPPGRSSFAAENVFPIGCKEALLPAP